MYPCILDTLIEIITVQLQVGQLDSSKITIDYKSFKTQ